MAPPRDLVDDGLIQRPSAAAPGVKSAAVGTGDELGDAEFGQIDQRLIDLGDTNGVVGLIELADDVFRDRLVDRLREKHPAYRRGLSPSGRLKLVGLARLSIARRQRAFSQVLRERAASPSR